MNLTIRPQSTVGSVLQGFCYAVLEAVVLSDARVESNGSVGAKLEVPGKFGDHYLYLGFDPVGQLVAFWKRDMAPGRADLIWGPKKLRQINGLSVQKIADQLTDAVYARMPELLPETQFLQRVAAESSQGVADPKQD